METKVVNSEFRINIPLQKSDREDGWFITGVAAGTEPDLQGDAFSQHAISMAAQQINSGPLPFFDWHKKDSVLSELGEVTKAWVDDNFHLNVEVKLDEDHYGARTIWSKINKGKQFGMSVHGRGLAYRNEVDGGRPVRRINSVLLDEISLTTKPVWTPSFGTVLSKAIESADDSVETGDDFSMNEKTPAQAAEETTETVSKAEETVVATTVETPAPEAKEAATDSNAATEDTVATEATTTETTEATATVPQTPENDQPEVAVEKSLVVMGAQDVKKLRKLLAYLKELGLDTSDDAEEAAVTEESTDKPVEETTVSKAEETPATTETPAQDTVVTALAAQVVELTKALNDLRDRIPQKGEPGILVRKSEEGDPVAEFMAQATPYQRLRFALAAQHEEQDKFRG